MNELRRKIAGLRKDLRADEVKYRSEKAVGKLSSWLTKNAAEVRVVGLYRPLEPNVLGEADPGALIQVPELAQVHFAFPRVLDRIHGTIDFAIPIHPSDWRPGVYGNLEPRAELPAVDPQEFDIIVVPGVVFGVIGERIGMGGGFYDRYLMRASGALRIGFGFDFQVQAEPVPQADWDARMDVVITDHRAFETFARPTT